MANKVFELVMKVRDYEVDSEGIVNNACYLNYMEHTRHEFCEAAGLSFERMLRLNQVPVVRHIEVDYLSSLRSGQEFSSFLTVSRRGPRYIFHQWIVNNVTGQKAVDARVTIVNLVDGRLTRGEEWMDIFGKYLTVE